MTMNGKVLISFLGTNNYIDTYYQLEDGKRSSLVKYIQEALIELICRDWNVTDMIYIFCTDGENGSYNKNWEGSGNLKERLTNREIRPKIECKTIPEGFTKEEVWKIFDIVTDIIEPEYEIYLDITHSFRSIPLFSTTLFDYLKVMKGTELKHIYYGAFEKLGPAYMVKDMPHEKRIAPIIDMADIISLQETIMAAHDYFHFGKLSSISKTNKDDCNENKKIKFAITKLKEQLRLLDFYINTCKLDKIKAGKFLNEINKYFDTALSALTNKAEKLLLEKVHQDLKARFKPENDNKNIESAIDWAYKNGMLQQAYTLGQEYVINLTCDKLSKHIETTSFNNSKEFREFASAILAIQENDKENKNYQGKLTKFPPCKIDELFTLEWVNEVRKHYQPLANIRNALNHAKNTSYDEKCMLKTFKERYYPALYLLKKDI